MAGQGDVERGSDGSVCAPCTAPQTPLGRSPMVGNEGLKGKLKLMSAIKPAAQ